MSFSTLARFSKRKRNIPSKFKHKGKYFKKRSFKKLSFKKRSYKKRSFKKRYKKGGSFKTKVPKGFKVVLEAGGQIHDKECIYVGVGTAYDVWDNCVKNSFLCWLLQWGPHVTILNNLDKPRDQYKFIFWKEQLNTVEYPRAPYELIIEMSHDWSHWADQLASVLYLNSDQNPDSDWRWSTIEYWMQEHMYVADPLPAHDFNDWRYIKSVNIDDVRMKYTTDITLTLQNVTKGGLNGEQDEFNRNNIRSNPIVGKLYSTSIQSTKLRLGNRYINTQNVPNHGIDWTASRANGMMLNRWEIIKNIPVPLPLPFDRGLDLNKYKKPPAANNFGRYCSAKNIAMVPGQVSFLKVVQKNKTMTLRKLISLWLTLWLSSVTEIKLGKIKMVGLEKMLDAREGTADTRPKVNIDYQVVHKYSSVFYLKKSRLYRDTRYYVVDGAIPYPSTPAIP